MPPPGTAGCTFRRTWVRPNQAMMRPDGSAVKFEGGVVPGLAADQRASPTSLSEVLGALPFSHHADSRGEWRGLGRFELKHPPRSEAPLASWRSEDGPDCGRLDPVPSPGAEQENGSSE